MRRYRIIREEFVSPKYSSSEIVVDEYKSDTYLAIEDDVKVSVEKDLRKIQQFKEYNVAVHQPDIYNFTGIVFGYKCDPTDPTAGVVLNYHVEIIDE